MKINIKNHGNVLNRSEMRSVIGGGACNKCCWSGTTNCSTCNGGNSCVSGATLTACGAGDCKSQIQEVY